MIPAAALLSLLLLQTQDPADSDREWKDKDRAEADVVAAAMASPDRAWKLITARDSPYAERRAVAALAGEVLDLSFLTKIDALRAELATHPEAMRQPGDTGVLKPGEQMIVSGRRDVPASTFKIRREGPWRWQVMRALDDAWYSIIGSAEVTAFSTWATALPCASAGEAQFFRKTTADYAKWRRDSLPVEMIGAWRNLLLRTGPAGGGALSPFVGSAWALRLDDPDSGRFAHVLVLDRVEAGDVYGAGFYAYQLRERYTRVPGEERPGPIPYSAVLAIAREAISNESLDPYVRVMSGLGVARALGEKLPLGDLRVTVDEDQPEAIRRFAEWFAEREEAVIRGAAAETAGLDRARKTLAQVRQCAAGEPVPWP